MTTTRADGQPQMDNPLSMSLVKQAVRERVMSKDTKVGKTRHEAEGVSGMDVNAKLAEWETLTEAATEGPWTPEREGDPALPDATEFWWVASDTVPLGTRGDAEFIAHARTAMPALLGFVEDVRALHVSSSESRGVGRVDPETGEWGAYCDHDSEWWPCPTVQAVQKWIGGA